MTETAGPDKVASAEQIGLSAREAASLPPRDAASWAKKVDRLYADAESFTLMTPQGHMFAGWITFSAEREGDTTIVQAQVLMRANDPLYEIAMTLGGHRKEDKFWVATLTALGQRLGIQDPKVDTRSTCVDSSRQWRHSRNVWHNSMVRSVLQTLAAPVTGLGRLMRGSKRGMKSQPNG